MAVISCNELLLADVFSDCQEFMNLTNLSSCCFFDLHLS